MDPIKVMQAWMEKYDLITSDIKLEADPGSNPASFRYTITGFIQPKCNCREVTSLGESAQGIQSFVPCSAEGCPVHGALAHKRQRIATNMMQDKPGLIHPE